MKLGLLSAWGAGLLLVTAGCQAASRPPVSPSDAAHAGMRERASRVTSLPLDLAEGERLRLMDFDGPLNVRAIEGGTPKLVMHLGVLARDRGAAVEGLARIGVRVEKDGGLLELRLEVPEDDFSPTNSSYDLFIPRGIRLSVLGSSAGVRALGPLAAASIETSHGDVDLRDVAGNVSVSTGTGDIALERIEGDRVEVRPRFGDVSLERTVADRLVCVSRLGEVRVLSSRARVATFTSDHGGIDIHDWSGNLDAHTSSGDVLLSSARADTLDLHSGFGNVLVRNASGALSVTAPRGAIDIADFDGALTTNSTSGDVHVDATLDSVRILSSNGDVHARLRAGSRLSERSRIQARRGNVEVLLPGDLDCRLEARTGNGSIHTLVPLLVEAGQSSDTELLEGILGQGGTKLVVETSVGDIRIGQTLGR